MYGSVSESVAGRYCMSCPITNTNTTTTTTITIMALSYYLLYTVLYHDTLVNDAVLLLYLNVPE